MPIGVVSDEDFDKEFPSETHGQNEPLPKPVIKDTPSRGRDEGDVNVPDSLRQIIAEENLLNGRQAALGLARDFGISPTSVSAYAKGSTSSSYYNTPSKSILSHINRSRERAVKKASRTLQSALSAITQDKLDYSDAKDLSGIAKDMSVIIKNLEPPKEQTESSGSSSPQFVIFAPQFRKEESFEVIDVKE